MLKENFHFIKDSNLFTVYTTVLNKMLLFYWITSNTFRQR